MASLPTGTVSLVMGSMSTGLFGGLFSEAAFEAEDPVESEG